MYIIRYDKRVESDLRSVSEQFQKQIRQAIEEKLIPSAEIFGKPLRHSLYGLRSLRVGDYHVIYTIEKSTVTIYLISHRSVAYKKILKRL